MHRAGGPAGFEAERVSSLETMWKRFEQDFICPCLSWTFFSPLLSTYYLLRKLPGDCSCFRMIFIINAGMAVLAMLDIWATHYLWSYGQSTGTLLLLLKQRSPAKRCSGFTSVVILSYPVLRDKAVRSLTLHTLRQHHYLSWLDLTKNYSHITLQLK